MIHLIGNKHSGHGPDGRRLYFKGGGGGQVKYDNLERLYDEQAASARLLRGIAEQNLPGATQAYVGNVQSVLAPGYANRQANMAGADMAGANAMERAATERNLTSMGVNPNDPRFAGALRSTQVNNAARMAAGKNVTRNQAEQYQLNVAKDAVGTFTGQSNNAATQMGNAASGLGSVYSSQANQKMAQDQAQANAVGNVANAGLTAYAMFAKDGGKVPGLAALGGKTVERHMVGGQAGSQQNQGFFQMQSIAPPPVAQAPQQQGGAISPATMANMAKVAGKNPTIGTAMDRAGSAIAEGAADAYTSVAGTAAQDGIGVQVVDKAFAPVAADASVAAAGDAAATAAGAGAAEAAGAAAAAEGAAAAGAVGAEAAAGAAAANAAGAGVMSTIGAALPWVGAAYAVGSLLDWWNEGGKVGTQNQGMSEQEAMQRFEQAEVTGTLADLRAGGRTPGEWVENRDTVPAMLVSGEQVLNSEASKLLGDKDAEKLNKKGLDLRAKGKTPKQIKTVGLAGLESMV